MTDNTLLLIDGHSMAFRAFYALRADAFKSNSGQYTNAVHGFTSTLLSLIGKYRPTHVAVAFDLPGGTFRTRMYNDYKGGRAATPEEFKGQIEIIQSVLDTLGISWLTYEDFEADDIVATLSTKGAEQGMRVYLASGDKDSYQLVNDSVTVLYPMPRQAMLEMTPEKVEERTGVLPERYEDLAALVGEGADNIPGVPGVGPKTAAKWIHAYGSLSELLDHAEEIKGKVGDSLREHLDQVRLNRQLNELVCTLPIGGNFDDFLMRGVDRKAMHQLFDTLDFNSLRNKVLSQLPMRELGEDEGDGDQASFAQSREKVPSLSFHALEGNALADFLRDPSGEWGISVVAQGERGAWSLETLALAKPDGEAMAFDVTELDEQGSRALQAFLEADAVTLVGHSMKAVRHALRAGGFEISNKIADSELLAYLLYPDQRSYDLLDLAMRYVDVDDVLDDVQGSKDQAGTLDLFVNSDERYKQVAAQALIALTLYPVMLADLHKQGMTDELVDLEREVQIVLYRMEERGIAIDRERLSTLVSEFSARVESAQEFAYEAIGDDSVNLSSPKQLQKVLFEDLGLPTTRKTKSGYTTNADALEGLLARIARREDEQALKGQQFLSALLDHRESIKLRQSVEGLGKVIGDDGRIHTTYQQTVAATGRLSSTDPNLQNIHARTEEGQQIREVFVPGKGYDYLMTADYSQIEMRLMAHLSGDESLIAAFNEGADLHRYVASRVYQIPEEEVTSSQRSHIKAVSYGLAYGLSAYGLSSQLKISVPQAQALMDGYFSMFGKVKAYLESLVKRAVREGYTETVLGRRRYLPDLASTNRQAREAAQRMALNAPIQGSAADVIKIAMLAVENSLAHEGLKSRVLLQVHDELVLEVVAQEVEKVREIVEREMGSAYQLSVPLTVGIGLGRTWRDAAH